MEQIILTSVFTVLALAVLGFGVSVYLKDASFVDIIWGLFFINIAIDLLFQVNVIGAPQILVSILVVVWGARLTYHIAMRRVGKSEDWRYAKWRKKWGNNFLVRSFFQIFILQAFLALIIAAPILVSANAGGSYSQIKWWQVAGVLVWAIGFLFESISDWQLDKFLKRRKKNQIMQSGLWHYSRHPNYFGEVVCWWGLWFIVIGLPYGWAAVVSPLLITGLILFVSGIPILEKKHKTSKEFQNYAAKTSRFVPLPPKT